MAFEQQSHVEPLLDSEQAARILRIHPKTLKRMAAAGEIPGMQIGKLWRFRASVLDKWMNEQLGQERVQ